MPMRLVQAAPERGAPLVLGYLLDTPVDAVLRAAFPHAEIRATVEKPLHPELPPPGRDVVGVAWSGGVQSLRALHLAGVRFRAVVALDGTSGSYPKQAPWQIEPWREVAEEARAGRCCAVLTSTEQLYTEDLRPPDVPYLATRHALELIVGQPLVAGQHLDDGALHVWPFPSARIDGAAHVRQVHEVLPVALDVVARWLAETPSGGANTGARLSPAAAARLVALSDDVMAGRTGLEDAMARATRDTDPAPAPPTFAELAVAWGLARLGLGEEPLGSNGGPWIKELLRPCRRRGTEALLGLEAANWCAAFASATEQGAAESCEAQGLEVPPRLGYRASVAELIADARAIGRWRDVAELRSGAYAIEPGDLPCFRRAGEDPRTGGQGHVGRAVHRADDAGRYTSLDGNHDNRVALVSRDLADEDLVGTIVRGA